MTQETLIEFPADIAVKAMGLNDGSFEALIVELVSPHIGSPDVEYTTVLSKGDKYLSVSIRFNATCLAQLHAVYGALKQEPRVLYML